MGLTTGDIGTHSDEALNSIIVDFGLSECEDELSLSHLNNNFISSNLQQHAIHARPAPSVHTRLDEKVRFATPECKEKVLYWDWPGKNKHDPVIKGSEAWETLYKQNTFDIRLYEYAQALFDAQGKIFHSSVWQEQATPM